MLYQLSYFRPRLEFPAPTVVGAESQNRTGDTAIFSRVLYQLSYLGPPLRAAILPRLPQPRQTSVPQRNPARARTPSSSSGGWPVVLRNRLMRSTMAGCVLKSPRALASNFFTGLTM